MTTRAQTARLAACFAGALLPFAAAAQDFESLPTGIAEIASSIVYDGVSDDLLTAGLGRTGLASATPPGFADPAAPTAAELRRLAIYNNYRALVDTTEGGGYGRLYGPNVTADGTITEEEGLIGGLEVIAYASTRTVIINGVPTRATVSPAYRFQPNVTMMVQVPATFDPAAACIVTGPSSGSRGVYGAIATSGEWGLKNGCAVAYTDKGTGTGAHDLTKDTVGLIDGIREDAETAGSASSFTAPLSETAATRFTTQFPDRIAFKHAHSRLNPEADWGQNVLTSIEFAFYVLNQEFPDADLTPDNTIVIGSSISNGGGSSVLAAEQDTLGLIDGIAVSEPTVNPVFDPGFAIQQGDQEPFLDHSQSLNTYYSVLNVFLGCAAASPDLALAPLNIAPSPDRCTSLADLGLVTGETLEAQAASAQEAINAAGFLEEQNILAPSHWAINVPQAIGVTYANAYGRFGVDENLCGYSFAATGEDNTPTPLADASEAALFATSNGIPPTGGVNLINNLGPNGPELDGVSTPDQNLDGHLCLRGLATGTDPVSGEPLLGPDLARATRIAQGVDDILASGDLGGLPAIFVTGRADAILPPNHTSRAYVGLNARVEGEASALTYVEITNAQHLDVLNGIGGFDVLYIPLHHYYIQALDLMLAHLRDGTALPPSQVVRTTTRAVGEGGLVQPVTVEDNLPPIADSPAADALITFETGGDLDLLVIPE